MQCGLLYKVRIYFDFNETTRRCIPEGYHIRTRRRENLKYLLETCYKAADLML